MADPQETARAAAEAEALKKYVGQPVVLDCRGPIVYVGVLESITESFYELKDADVHEMLDGRSSKEIYLMDARKYGIRKNRARVLVRRIEVVSLSLLEDVTDY